MSIIDFLNTSESERKNRAKEIRSASTQLGMLGAIGYGASKLASESNLKDSFSKMVQSEINQSRELGRVGSAIREDIIKLQTELTETTARKIQEKILNDNKLDEILTGTNVDIGERRALLASLFDSIKSEMEFDEGLGDKIKEAYQSNTPLSPEDNTRVKEFYTGRIQGDRTALEKFHQRYGKLSSVEDLLAGNALSLTKPSNQKDFKYGNLDNFRSQSNVFPQVEKKFNEIKGMFRGQDVQFVTRGKGSSQSALASIDFGSGLPKLVVPLHSARNDFGVPVFSGTESGATKYGAPLQILDASKMHTAGYQRNARGFIPGLTTFDEMVFTQLKRGVEQRGSNFRKGDINNFYSWMRSFGADLPRSMDQSVSAGGVSPALSTNISASKAMQSSSIFISNLDQLSETDRNQFVNRVMRTMPDVFGGPGAQQAQTMRFEDPFNHARTINYQQVQYFGQDNERTINPIQSLKGFGRAVDRSIQPQTAREHQLFGRPEFLSHVQGLDKDYKFGANRNIKLFGAGGDLLGVDPTGGKHVRGANMAMFMVMGDKASELGLSEGSAYSGGRYSVSTGLTKTVSQQGVEKFELMQVLEARQALHQAGDTGDQFIRVGDFETNMDEGRYNINDFFKKFGKRGEAILGFNDADFSSIKRHAGLTSFTLGITGVTESGGRNKVHLSGDAIKGLPFMKLFSAGFKGTLEFASKEDVASRLSAMGIRNQHATFSNLVSHEASLFTDESMIKKSSQYLAMQMFGGFTFFGGESKKFEQSMIDKIGADENYKTRINTLISGQFSNLDDIPVAGRRAGFLSAVIESIAVNRGKMSSEELGMVLGGFRQLGTRFGFENQGAVDEMITRHFGADVLTEAKRGVAVGAMYAASGDVYSDLGRNLAKVEPRFANYMYQTLRSNFGLGEAEATDYLSSIIARQEGVENRSGSIIGMKMAQFSLSGGSTQDMQAQLRGVSGIGVLSETQARDVLDLAGREKEVAEYLSKNKSGNILETNKLGLSSKAQKSLEDFLGGKSSFTLAGADTFEGLKGHIIRSQGKDVNIENEYIRYNNDLVSALGSLRDAGEDEKRIRSAMSGLESSRASLAKVTASSFRNVLSGKVLGSGTYRGRGISLGMGGSKNLGGKLISGKSLGFKSKIFDRTGGYAIFGDTQAFMDGMSTFKEAARRDLMRKSGKHNVNQEVNDLMRLTLRNFFLGVYDVDPKGVMTDSQRNPLVGITNIFANIEMFRGDAFDDEGGDFFKNFYRNMVAEDKVRYERNDATKAAYNQFLKEERAKVSASETTERAMKEHAEEILSRKSATPEQKRAAGIISTEESYTKLKEIQTKAREGADLDFQRKVGLSSIGKDKELSKLNRRSFMTYLDAFMGKKGHLGSVSHYSLSHEEETQRKLVRKSRGISEARGLLEEQRPAHVAGLGQLMAGEERAKYLRGRISKIRKGKKQDKGIITGLLQADLDEVEASNKALRGSLTAHKQYDHTVGLPENVKATRVKHGALLELSPEVQTKKEKDIQERITNRNAERAKLDTPDFKKKKANELQRANAQAREAARARMRSEDVLTNQGKRVEYQVGRGSNLAAFKTMEEAYIGTGQASTDFKTRPEGMRFASLREVHAAESAVAGTEGEAGFQKAHSKVLNRMLDEFIESGPQGGGTVEFFDVKVKSADLIGKSGELIQRGGFEGRTDVNRAGIGDFDGDIYQVFFRSQQDAAGRIHSGAPKAVLSQALSMEMMLQELRSGMDNLGSRMGVSNMTEIASAISEKEKERIFKGVGSVDVQVRTAMMGLAQAASDATDPESYARKMKAGMTLLTAMEEVLVIQAKKLPTAADVPQELSKALKESFRTGDASRLKTFLTENIFRDTNLAKHGEIGLDNIEFANINNRGAGAGLLRESYGDARLNLDEVFAALDEGVRAVKTYGLDKMPSDSPLGRAIQSGKIRDIEMLSNLMSASMTMEGGLVGGNSDEAIGHITRIMNEAERARNNLATTFMQKAGALGVAGGLVAAGVVGSFMGTGKLNPGGNFSDMRSRENLSMRSLQQNMQREHGNVSPRSVGGPQDNFYERPIFSGETTVRSNVSTRFYGEAATMSSGVSMARQFVSAGGQAAMHINDNRMPISNSYITKSIRD